MNQTFPSFHLHITMVYYLSGLTNFRLLEDAYVMKDPFSSEGGIITLGSHCSLCEKAVCLSTVSTGPGISSSQSYGMVSEYSYQSPLAKSHQFGHK